METNAKRPPKVPAAAAGTPDGRQAKNASLLLIRRNKVLYLFILPAFLYFLIFAYVPMYGVQIAFKDFVASKGFSGSPWAEPLFKHFITFFSSINFWNILGNTLKLSLYYIARQLPAAVVLALMINEGLKHPFQKKRCRISPICPTLFPPVVLRGHESICSFPTTGWPTRSARCLAPSPSCF